MSTPMVRTERGLIGWTKERIRVFEQGARLGAVLADEVLRGKIWKEGYPIKWMDGAECRMVIIGEELQPYWSVRAEKIGVVVIYDEVSETVGTEIVGVASIDRGVEEIGIRMDPDYRGYQHIGRFKGFRGNTGDIVARTLKREGDFLEGSLLLDAYGRRVEEIIESIKKYATADQV